MKDKNFTDKLDDVYFDEVFKGVIEKE